MKLEHIIVNNSTPRHKENKPEAIMEVLDLFGIQ